MRQTSETEKVTANEILYKQEGIRAPHCNCGATLFNEPSQTPRCSSVTKKADAQKTLAITKSFLSQACAEVPLFLSVKNELRLAAGLACQQWSGCSAD